MDKLWKQITQSDYTWEREALEFAKRVIEEYERSGQAVFKIEGEMVDAPVIERCRQLLAQ